MAGARGSEDRSRLVVAIGIFKLVKAALLGCVVVLASMAYRNGAAAVLAHIAQPFRLDMATDRMQRAYEHVAGATPRQIEAVGFGTLIYAAVFLVEGIGLVLRRRWAEWLTVVVTASFVPLEIMELARRFTVARVITIVVNLGILAYLVVRRVHDRSSHHRAHGAYERSRRR